LQNQERRPLYAALSGNQSLSVSDAFIKSEKWSLQYSRFLMFRTRDLRAAGIPILCSEFTPISLTPKFLESFVGESKGSELKNYEALPLTQVANELKPHIKNLNIEEIKSVALKWTLLSYNQEPRFNCMARHVLESIYATAEAAQENLKIAKSLGLEKRTEKFTKKFLGAQVFGFKTIADIDKKASQIQALNIPIVCNDVPAILDLDSLK